MYRLKMIQKILPFTSSTEAQETTDDGELENLPPPPPPPNILPPGPPPNIVPAER